MPVKNLRCIDWLRALCAVYIVAFWHVGNYLPNEPFEHPITSRLTVLVLGVFFLTSGFLVGQTKMPFWAFMRKRFVRIYGPFLCASIVFVGIGLGTAYQHLTNVLLVSSLLHSAPLTLWFVGMICLFYVLAPLLISLQAAPIRFGAVVTLVLITLLAATRLWGADERLIMYFAPFAAGIFYAKRELPKGIWLLGLTLAAIVSGVLAFATNANDTPLLTPLALTGALVVMVLAMSAEPILQYNRVVSEVAFASYFAYLIHRIVYDLLIRAFPYDTAGARLALLELAGVPLTFVLAWILQRAYNDLFRARDKAFGSPR